MHNYWQMSDARQWPTEEPMKAAQTYNQLNKACQYWMVFTPMAFPPHLLKHMLKNRSLWHISLLKLLHQYTWTCRLCLFYYLFSRFVTAQLGNATQLPNFGLTYILHITSFHVVVYVATTLLMCETGLTQRDQVFYAIYTFWKSLLKKSKSCVSYLSGMFCLIIHSLYLFLFDLP